MNVESEFERIDAAVADHFSGVGGAPRQTLRRFDPLLSALFGTVPLTGNDLREFDVLQQQTEGFIDLGAPLSYCVASYWSPINQQRHSTFHTGVEKDHTPRSRAAAALFFSMSHVAGYQSEYSSAGLYTATHFLVQYAKRKWSLPIIFRQRNSIAEVTESAWFIPVPTKHQILAKIGWTELLSELEQEYDQEADGIERFTRMAIAHLSVSDQPQMSDESRSKELGKRALENFRNTAYDCHEMVEQLGRQCVNELQRMWDVNLTVEQAAFMTASYMLWHEAVPGTKRAFTFPSRVENTVCVLTMGTGKSFGKTQTTMLSWLSKTIFVHPLIQDYATLLSEKYLRAEREVIRRAIGHNVPKLLVQPVRRIANKMHLGLKHANKKGKLENPEKHEAVVKTAESGKAVLDLLLGHYGGVVEFLADPDGASRVRLSNVKSEYVHLKKIRKQIELLFEHVLRDQYPKKIASISKLIFDGFNSDFRGGSEFVVMEFLINLINNSCRHMNDGDLDADQEKGVVNVSFRASKNPDEGIFIVKDRAGGFDRMVLDRVQESISMIENAPDDKYSDVTIALIDGKAVAPRSDGSLGIGLITTAYYMRQLKNVFGRSGRLTVENVDDGAKVTVFMPVIM